MKTNSQPNSSSSERRRWLSSLATGLAGVAAWKFLKRDKNERSTTAAKNESPVAAAETVAPARPSSIVVRPAPGAVKRHG